MIPQFDVEPVVDYDPGRLRVLTGEEIVDGFAVVRDYQHLRDFDWDEVGACLRAEESVLDQARREARSESEFEELVSAAEDEAYEGDEGDQIYFGLDIGAAALVLALCAVKGVTYYSCRGRVAGSRHQASCPQVGVVLDRERASIVAGLSAEASCGFESEIDGKLGISGRSVDDLHRLAGMIFSHRADFDAIPDPDWVAAVNEIYRERSAGGW
jgi:hypothetical protein